MGDWRLLFLHRDRLRTATVERRRSAWRRSTSSRRTAPSASSSRRRSPTAPRFRRRPDVAADAEGLQGRRGRRRGRSVRPVPRQHRVADHQRDSAGRTEAVAPAQEDARRHGGRRPDAAVRRREEPDEPEHRRAARRRDADAGHHEAHAPADSGRVRSAEGARQRRRRRDHGNASIETTRENLPGRAAAGRRGAARAVVPGRRVRAAPPAAAGQPRRAAGASRRPSPCGSLPAAPVARTRGRRPLRRRPSTNRSPI